MELITGIFLGIFIGILFKYTIDNILLKQYTIGKWLDYLIKNGYIKFGN